MIRAGIFALASCVGLLFFPWGLTAAFTLLATIWEPLMPLAVGILADALYYTPHHVPLFTLMGALGTLFAYIVHRSVKTSIIRG